MTDSRPIDPARRRALAALIGFTAAALLPPAYADAFDHSHAAWSSLLKKHVRVLRGGRASALDYAGMTRDRAALDVYLAELTRVTEADFARFSRDEQMAFLINLYNAETVAFVLTRYPDLKSIKDLGSVFASPWEKDFIPLFGRRVSLDHVEHEMLRVPGRYDDPRIHFAVNCASVGCPSLREEAYVGARLDAQLDEQTQRFLSDRTRNRWNDRNKRLEVSKIFDWYGGDFEKNYRGIQSLPEFFAGYAKLLADAHDARTVIAGKRAQIDFLDYDWLLNDSR